MNKIENELKRLRRTRNVSATLFIGFSLLFVLYFFKYSLELDSMASWYLHAVTCFILLSCASIYFVVFADMVDNTSSKINDMRLQMSEKYEKQKTRTRIDVVHEIQAIRDKLHPVLQQEVALLTELEHFDENQPEHPYRAMSHMSHQWPMCPHGYDVHLFGKNNSHTCPKCDTEGMKQ